MLVYEFTRSLQGYPHLFSNLSARAFELLPVDSRAAFPSLHAAVSLVALVYAWRFVRAWFWMLLPFCSGLWVSTVYLRHHYVVDLIAGWMLAPVAIWMRRGSTPGGRGGSGRYGYTPPSAPPALTARTATEDTELRARDAAGTAAAL